jgi:glycosyltransferase involved in cell wall biosynthesis
MLIVADLREYGNGPEHRFGYECIRRIAAATPGHRFIGLTASGNISDQSLPPNFTITSTAGKIKHNLLDLLWYNYQLPVILKKYNADLFISDRYLSLKTGVPQVFIAANARHKKKEGLLRKMLQKAERIVCFSASVKSGLKVDYKLPDEKFDIIFPGPDEVYRPLDWNEKKEVKAAYTNEKEYFMYAGERFEENMLLNLLKAFTVFKKRQKSNMQLLVAGTGKIPKGFLKSLSTYKYRDDVMIVDHASAAKLAQLTAAAYAAIDLNGQLRFTKLLAAMQCGVPVLAVNSALMMELFGEAALYFNPASYEDIANQLMLVFKDENKRNELIEQGDAILAGHQWELAADRLAQLLFKS